MDGGSPITLPAAGGLPFPITPGRVRSACRGCVPAPMPQGQTDQCGAEKDKTGRLRNRNPENPERIGRAAETWRNIAGIGVVAEIAVPDLNGPPFMSQ